MAWAAVFLCSDPWFFFSSFLCRALAPTLSHSSAFSTSAGVFWFCVLCFDDACETGLHQLNGLSGSTCFTFSSCLCLMFLLLLACFGFNFFFLVARKNFHKKSYFVGKLLMWAVSSYPQLQGYLFHPPALQQWSWFPDWLEIQLQRAPKYSLAFA